MTMESGYKNPEWAFGGTRPLLELIELMYSTVQNPSIWPVVMERIAVAMQGESLALWAIFPESKVPSVLALREMPQDVWNSFAGYYASINPMMEKAQARLDPRKTWFSHHAISDHELENTECYTDFYKPNNMHFAAGMQIALEGLPPANLSCQRPKSIGEFDIRADIVCSTLRPHLQRVLKLHYRLGNLQAETLGLQAALDAHEHAVFGLDRFGKVVFCNPLATRIVSTGDTLVLRSGRLNALDSTSARALSRVVSLAIAGGTGRGISAGGACLIARQNESSPLRLTATPFSGPAVLGSPRVVALVFVSDPVMAPLSRASVMRALFRLTPAESRIAMALLEGNDVRQAAEYLGLTLETARLYTKRVLNKSGVRRQSELIKLMVSLPGSA